MKQKFIDVNTQSIVSIICDDDENQYVDQVSVVDAPEMDTAIKERIQTQIEAIDGFEDVDFDKVDVSSDCTIYTKNADGTDNLYGDIVEVKWENERKYNELRRATIKINCLDYAFVIACDSATCGIPEMKFRG